MKVPLVGCLFSVAKAGLGSTGLVIHMLFSHPRYRVIQSLSPRDSGNLKTGGSRLVAK